jgi:Ca2+-transporting ATPase
LNDTYDDHHDRDDNAIYGTFGGIMALLLWIYISGCIFIFGACLCAAQTEGR